MEFANVKIGIDATIYSSIKMGLQLLNLYGEINPESMWFEDHLMGLIPESIWEKEIVPIADIYKNPNQYFDPFVLISSIADKFKKVKFGTSVADCIRRGPPILAQTSMTLSQITNGRFMLGIGAGEAMNLIPYGYKHENPITTLEEGILTIRNLWNHTKNINFKGKTWNLNKAVFGIAPYKKEQRPPIWIAAHGSQGLDIVGRYGDGWIPLFNMIQNEAEYNKSLKMITDSAKKGGREAASIVPSLYATLITDNQHDISYDMIDNPFIKTLALLQPNSKFKKYGIIHPLGENFRGIVDFIPSRYSKEVILDAFEQLPFNMLEDLVFFGTPDEIIKKIESFKENGLRHIIFQNVTPFTDPNKLSSSIGCIKKIIEYFS